MFTGITCNINNNNKMLGGNGFKHLATRCTYSFVFVFLMLYIIITYVVKSPVSIIRVVVIIIAVDIQSSHCSNIFCTMRVLVDAVSIKIIKWNKLTNCHLYISIRLEQVLFCFVFVFVFVVVLFFLSNVYDFEFPSESFNYNYIFFLGGGCRGLVVLSSPSVRQIFLRT